MRLITSIATTASFAAAASVHGALLVNFSSSGNGMLDGSGQTTVLTDPTSMTDFTVGVSATSALTLPVPLGLPATVASSGGGLGVDSVGQSLIDGGQDLDNTTTASMNNGVLETLLYDFNGAGSTPGDVDIVLDIVRVQNVNSDAEGIVISNGTDMLTLSRATYGDFTGGSSTPTFQNIGFTIAAGQTLSIVATDGGSVRVRDLGLSVTPVPEPSAVAGVLGIGALVLRRRR